MITHLHGKLVEKKPPIAVVDVNGIGYEIHAPMSTFYELPTIGSAITLLTHCVVREDAHLLFGFHSESERKLFRTLIKVNGVGPKLALAILSGMEIDRFVQCVQTQNSAQLTNIPGIGKKTAERLVVEMRDALKKWEDVATLAIDINQIMQDAMSALTALGYKPHEAKVAVTKVHQPNHNSEQLIRLALQTMMK
ncbi:MAG: Holliday junction DNA helicase RuvA [uncultured bacterium]|nr:MAG: Holliday junction DNA helicase RuvA [uncultured bacterium]OGT26745.1 MAG: Holliday junction DNA helicase RuvA [Gammaproteobacteria bacterium RIFCSPHIGHO2_02_FULL_42_43]OGT29147.1 MAG: Holliday junction DNA helicase RuvA [Gammaproteobacteria bacterium RIFCSPHIGHO2_01_FULL_42_8]OGT52947.1 MAG: Holliday junction DNA helicase RuvA [Gammaproteobacteria bacterium RIFCSPHIGHO2_12_FULL_41_25]OGT61279.1 MAG: Holliday junction DNA helicase RuvA [Gammaproteobacteria bacterium RIFCSPLOWO2_02_FULL_4